MSDADIEMTPRNGDNRPSHSRTADAVTACTTDEQDRPYVMPVIRRQNQWCGCSLVLILSSLAVFLVGRVYMTPDEGGLESVLIPLDQEQPDTVDNDAVTDRPTRSHTSIIGTLLGNATSQSAGRDKSDLQTWLRKHGHVPNDHNPKPRPNHEATPQNATVPKKTADNDQTQLFDKDRWFNSTVTLEDGVKFRVLRELSHDAGSFLEGLTYGQGFLFESAGLFHKSSIRRLDPDTGDVIEMYDLDDRTLFAEGLAIVDEKLFQLTYKRKLGFIYDAHNISKPIGNFTFESTTGEGWGLTYAPDTNELIMSDGSEYLHMIDPATLAPTRKVHVTRGEGRNARNINELEYFHGRVLANVWYHDIILVINPSTGVVEKEYDFSTLWLQSERSQKGAEVLNGISISSHPRQLYITGKNWERMFLVE